MTDFELINLIKELGITFNHFNNKYYNKNKVEIINIDNYLYQYYIRHQMPYDKKTIPKIKNILFETYDFERVPYKTYLQCLVNNWNNSPKIIDNMRKQYNQYLESIQTINIKKQCIYIHGKAGSGKTTLAKIIAEEFLYKNNRDEIFITAAGDNPFDDYYGERCVIIDDFRDSVMKYNDVLRLLDNNTNSNIGARYHNKNLARCKHIIITSTKHPNDLYPGIEEERYQLYRRIILFDLFEKFVSYKEYNIQKGTWNETEQKPLLDMAEVLNNFYLKNGRTSEDIDIYDELKQKIIELDEYQGLPF